MHTAIRASANSVVAVVRTALESDPSLGPRFTGTMQVSLRTPQEMRDDNLEGLSVFLHLIELEGSSRNRPPLRPEPNEEIPPPLPLCLHILFTPVVATLDPAMIPDVEHEILGKVVQTWHSHPFLRGDDLVDDLEGTASELAISLAPMSLESMTRVWDALEQPYQLSLAYELRTVDVCSARASLPVAPVLDVVTPVGALLSEGTP